MSDELTAKEEVFAQVLAETDDQAKAYRAMIPTTKAKPESIWAKASKIANKDKVRLRVAELKVALKEKAEKEFDISAGRVLKEIASLAFNDPRKAFDEDGNLLPIQQWPDEVAAAISSIKITEQKFGDDEPETYLKEIKFWDKNKPLENAAKITKVLSDKLQLDLNVNIAEELAQLKQQAVNATTRD